LATLDQADKSTATDFDCGFFKQCFLLVCTRGTSYVFGCRTFQKNSFACANAEKLLRIGRFNDVNEKLLSDQKLFSDFSNAKKLLRRLAFQMIYDEKGNLVFGILHLKIAE